MKLPTAPPPAAAASDAGGGSGSSLAPFLLQLLSKLFSVFSSVVLSRVFGLPANILAAAVFHLPTLQTTALFLLREGLRRTATRPIGGVGESVREDALCGGEEASDALSSDEKEGAPDARRGDGRGLRRGRARGSGARRASSSGDRSRGSFTRSRLFHGSAQRSRRCSSMNLAFLGVLSSALFSAILAIVWLAALPDLRSASSADASASGAPPRAGRQLGFGSFRARGVLEPTPQERNHELEVTEDAATVWSYRLAVGLFCLATLLEAAAEPFLTAVVLRASEAGAGGSRGAAEAAVYPEATGERSDRNRAYSDGGGTARGGQPSESVVPRGQRRGEGQKRDGLSPESRKNDSEPACRGNAAATRDADEACRLRALAEAAATVSKMATILALLGFLRVIRPRLVTLHTMQAPVCHDAAGVCGASYASREPASWDPLGGSAPPPQSLFSAAASLLPAHWRLTLALACSHPLAAFGGGQVVYSLVWLFVLARAALQGGASMCEGGEEEKGEARGKRKEGKLRFTLFVFRRYLQALQNVCCGRCSCSYTRCRPHERTRSANSSEAAFQPPRASPPPPAFSRGRAPSLAPEAAEVGARRASDSAWSLRRLRRVVVCLREVVTRAHMRLSSAKEHLVIAEHRRLLRVNFGLMLQKFLGTEGEKLLLLALLSPDAAGEYAFVSAAASIFCRLFFAPIEEAAFTAFCAQPVKATALASVGPAGGTETMEPSGPKAPGPRGNTRQEGGRGSGTEAKENGEIRLISRRSAILPVGGNMQHHLTSRKEVDDCSLHQAGNLANSGLQPPSGLRCRSHVHSADRHKETCEAVYGSFCGDESPRGGAGPADEGQEEVASPAGDRPLPDSSLEAAYASDGAFGPSLPLLRRVLALEGTLGLVAAANGPLFARAALRFVYGPRWGNCPGAVAALQVYSVYLFLLAVYGLLDAYTMATASPEMLRLLRRLNGVATAFHLVVSLPSCVSLYPERQAAAVVGMQCLFAVAKIGFSLLPFAYRLASLWLKPARSLESLRVVSHASPRSKVARGSAAFDTQDKSLRCAEPHSVRSGLFSETFETERDPPSRWRSLAEASPKGARGGASAAASPSELWTPQRDSGGSEKARFANEPLDLGSLLSCVPSAALLLLPPSLVSLVLPIVCWALFAAAVLAAARRAPQMSCSRSEPFAKEFFAAPDMSPSVQDASGAAEECQSHEEGGAETSERMSCSRRSSRNRIKRTRDGSDAAGGRVSHPPRPCACLAQRSAWRNGSSRFWWARPSLRASSCLWHGRF
ncbi:hypothetical protein BESB_017790 [Besnoitia besnoiti]|uniref:Man(5)GlcNAc(2)-PP-dolichol translocation protein RFT1 n=1 Tax=Besnoitia besnoiti TaxID=94643 RepID=A0A2A9M844_BESBE|nr:hypothetical protein BESB_017790 [Besnoitia besnoiti]PFH32461.1 hypothetical protein BESB_017790 [Besnoitia besnoiti]